MGDTAAQMKNVRRSFREHFSSRFPLQVISSAIFLAGVRRRVMKHSCRHEKAFTGACHSLRAQPAWLWWSSSARSTQPTPSQCIQTPTHASPLQGSTQHSPHAGCQQQSLNHPLLLFPFQFCWGISAAVPFQEGLLCLSNCSSWVLLLDLMPSRG